MCPLRVQQCRYLVRAFSSDLLLGGLSSSASVSIAYLTALAYMNDYRIPLKADLPSPLSGGAKHFFGEEERVREGTSFWPAGDIVRYRLARQKQEIL